MTKPPAGTARIPGRAWSSTKRRMRRLTSGGAAERASVASTSARFLEPILPVAPTTPPGPTIVLLNDCRDQVNYGAEALVDGLIRILQQRAPDATIRPIPSHWVIDASHGLGAFVNGGAGLRQPNVRYPEVADQYETVADDWLEGRGGPDVADVLRCFENADVVVLNGEGSIYRTNSSAIRELFLAWLAKERLGIPTVYVNGGIHLTDVMPLLNGMVRKTFACLDAVAVREPRSLRNVREYVPGVDVQLFPDSAFVLSPDDAAVTEAVATVRGRIGDAPYFCFDPGPMPIDARPGGASTLHRLISMLKTTGRQAVLVCSAPADAYIEAIADETGSIYVDTILDYREFMALTAEAQFLVSGRYHNPMLAAIMGCPTIAIASTNHKVHGALETLDGILGTPYDGTYLLPELDAIAQRAESYAQDRATWGNRLRDICARRREEVMGIGDLVNRVARSRT